MYSKSRLISGKVPVSNSASVSADRYQFLDLTSAEPNLGTANNGNILRYSNTSIGQREWIDPNSIISFEKQYSRTGTITLGDTGTKWYTSSNVTIISAIARVDTAPTGGNLSLSIKKNGTSNATLTILPNQTTSNYYTTPIFANAGDYFTIEVTSIGSTFAGEDLYVVVSYLRRQ
jgi:hypothetical protein